MAATSEEKIGARTVSVTFQPGGRRFDIGAGEVLFEAATEAGVDVDTVCGGQGSCGKCKVRFDDDPPEPTPIDFVQLTAGELAKGYRLSCQIVAERDMVVFVPESGEAAKVEILQTGVSRDVELRPNIRKLFLPHANPRDFDGVADWDRVRDHWPREARPTDISLRLLRRLPAALRDERGVTLVMAGRRVIDLEPGNTVIRQYGVAFDIGSTTAVGYLIDLGTGEEVAVASAVNKQTRYGDDIIGRLSRAQRNPEGLEKLHGMLIEQVDDLLGQLVAAVGAERSSIYELTVVGNMAMHHFLLRLDSTYLGLAPYAPVTRSSVAITAAELGLDLAPEVPVFVLPNIAGFVGSDTVGVMLATEIGGYNDLRIAIDVGTNGEMVAGNRKRLIACSAPAGPALEGARIKMGMRAAPGAIDHLWIDDDVRYSVIGGSAPRGLCGSGLIDVVGQLLDARLVGPSGAFNRHRDLAESVPAALRDRLIEAPQRRDTYFVLAREGENGAEREVVFTQQDVREMQLAKGAIRAGTMMLIAELGLEDDDMTQVMLAGAFGNFIDAANALRCGLTPQVPLERIVSVGNAAGVGAKIALVNMVERRKCERMAQKTEHIQLSGSKEFQRAFTLAMRFPKQE